MFKPDDVNAPNLKAVQSCLCLSLSLSSSLFCACELRRLIRGLSCGSISGRGRESLMPGKVAHKGNRAIAKIREDVETLRLRQQKYVWVWATAALIKPAIWRTLNAYLNKQHIPLRHAKRAPDASVQSAGKQKSYKATCHGLDVMWLQTFASLLIVFRPQLSSSKCRMAADWKSTPCPSGWEIHDRAISLHSALTFHLQQNKCYHKSGVKQQIKPSDSENSRRALQPAVTRRAASTFCLPLGGCKV